jgi:hypothetical protein
MPRLFRTAALAALAWLASAAPLAAKPPAPDPSDPRQIYRDRGISICVAEMRSIPDITPDDLEAMCGCAFDRFMPRWPTGALPPLAPDRIAPVVGSELLSCAAGQDSELAAAVARRLSETAMRAPPVAPLPPPGETAAPDKPPEPAGPGLGLRAWFDGLSPPRWLAGVPRWAWPPIALLVFALVGALFRRRDGRRDLMGPPRAMRPGARLGPPPR